MLFMNAYDNWVPRGARKIVATSRTLSVTKNNLRSQNDSSHHYIWSKTDFWTKKLIKHKYA